MPSARFLAAPAPERLDALPEPDEHGAMSRSDPLPDLVYNGMAYRLADGAPADLEARGVIAPGVDGEARYGLSLEHDFGEVAPFVTAAAPPRETPPVPAPAPPPRLRR